MSESNAFEIVMQQKMEAFQVEPAASDWQAIYDVLHPRKKRRIIWWWIPLIAALGAGIFWTYNEKTALQHTAMVATNADKKTAEEKQIVPTGSELQKKSLATERDNRSDNDAMAANQAGNDLSTQPSSGSTSTVSNHQASTPSSPNISQHQPSTRSNAIISKKQVSTSSNTNVSELQSSTRSNSTVSNHQASIATKSIRKNTSGTTEKQAGINPVMQSPEPAKQDPVQETQKTESPAIVTTAQAVPEAHSENKSDAVKKDSILMNTAAPSTKATIPVSNKTKRWIWGAYIGTGPNYVTEPLKMGARALSGAPDYSTGGNSGSRTYASSQEENGWHFAGGIVGEKKMGNNWLFTAGLGINSSTWKTSVERYKDSIYNGAFYSTTKVSEESNAFRLWMAELPLQFSNRIAGKKAGSLWWTIGINNQFRLSLQQKSSVDSTSGQSLSDSRTLTSTTRFYQPQFRLGLMYNHNGKVHWQLQPLFQYSFTGVYTPDISDKPVLASLQLQYRLFLQPKKEGKKQAK